jgi:hypothetical protein
MHGHFTQPMRGLTSCLVLWNLAQMSMVGAAGAIMWIAIASVISLSLGLARAGPALRKYFPPLRADAWRVPSCDLWTYICCHTIYVPVVLSLLRVADCRAVARSRYSLTDALGIRRRNSSLHWKECGNCPCLLFAFPRNIL